MIATIALVGAFNLPDAGNSAQRETVQEVPGVFNSQRRKEISRTATLDCWRADFGPLKRRADRLPSGIPEGQRSPERLDTFHEGNPKAGRPHVPTDKPAVKTSPANRELCLEFRAQEEILWPLEEGTGSSGELQGCHEVMQGEN